MSKPRIRHLLHADLVAEGCTPEQADELLDLGYRLGREMRERREAEEGQDPKEGESC